MEAKDFQILILGKLVNVIKKLNKKISLKNRLNRSDPFTKSDINPNNNF